MLIAITDCDGNSFSGSNATATSTSQVLYTVVLYHMDSRLPFQFAEYKNLTLHFRGKHILEAQISSLLSDRGMKNACALGEEGRHVLILK